LVDVTLSILLHESTNATSQHSTWLREYPESHLMLIQVVDQ
jgi:hypothetical protein